MPDVGGAGHAEFRKLRLGLLLRGELSIVDLYSSGGGDAPVGALLHKTGDAIGLLDGINADVEPPQQSAPRVPQGSTHRRGDENASVARPVDY